MAKFNDFNISKEIQQAIEQMGFTDATKIQAQSIPLLLEGKDLIGQAQTGTGKTVAFAIPCIEKIDTRIFASQALILCPTRELVIQVAAEFKKLTKFRKEIKTIAIYGGQKINTQLRALSKGADIIVSTPGRLMDHIRRQSIKLDQVKYLVLDEADQMLDMGFRDDIKDIIRATPKDRQTVMFSATMSKDLIQLMETYQRKAIKLNITGNKAQSQQIEQFYFELKRSPKLDALKRLLSSYHKKSGIIFCNTRAKVDELCQRLVLYDYKAAPIHGDIDQKKRNKVIQAFKAGTVELLVATDVAARGLDINDLELVLNYDLPRADQDYVHRIGRTGRAGKTGLALSLVTRQEIGQINRIATKNKLKISAAQLPGEEGTDSLKGDKSNNHDRKKNFKSKKPRRSQNQNRKKPRKFSKA